MSHYHHLSISEREKILILHTEGKSLRAIAVQIGRNVSTISREITRNGHNTHGYSAVEAESKYGNRRKKCRRKKLPSNVKLREVIKRLFLEEQWSPEQIAKLLRFRVRSEKRSTGPEDENVSCRPVGNRKRRDITYLPGSENLSGKCLQSGLCRQKASKAPLQNFNNGKKSLK